MTRRGAGRRGALVAILLAGGLAACGAEPVAVVPAPPVVAWSTLQAHAGAAGDAHAGLVRSARTTELGFASGGRLVSRDVDVGDAVRRGDVLAALDAAGLDALVASAEADVQSAIARRDGATRDEARIADLAAGEAVARAELESATDERRAAEAALDLARAQLAGARQRRDDARLAAPFDGVVADVGADAGDTVAPGAMVLLVADPSDLEVAVDVPPARAASIRPGARAEAVPELRTAVVVPGTVSRVAPLADPVSRGILVTVALADGAQALRLGSEVSVRFPDGAVARVRVPVRAVASAGGADADADGANGGGANDGDAVAGRVWMLDRSSSPVTVRAVDVAVSADGLAAVGRGLEPGVDVVVSGVDLLVDGQAVRPASGTLR